MLGSATAGSGQVRGREASNWLRFIVRPWQACRELPASAAGDLKGKDGGDLPTQESNEFPFNVFSLTRTVLSHFDLAFGVN